MEELEEHTHAWPSVGPGWVQSLVSPVEGSQADVDVKDSKPGEPLTVQVDHTGLAGPRV